MHPLRTTRVDKRSDVLRELVNAVVGGASAEQANNRAGEGPDNGIPARSAEEGSTAIVFCSGKPCNSTTTGPSAGGINDVEHELTAPELFHGSAYPRGHAAPGKLACARTTVRIPPNDVTLRKRHASTEPALSPNIRSELTVTPSAGGRPFRSVLAIRVLIFSVDLVAIAFSIFVNPKLVVDLWSPSLSRSDRHPR